jgi:CheY-like chemotaxis protein
MATFVLALLENYRHAEKIKTSLLGAGHDVLVVNSFPEAKLFLQTHLCDAIISDVHLENGGSVYDFLQWVKSDPRLTHIPFIFLSLEPTTLAKYLQDGVRVAARHLGAAKYINMEEFDPVRLNIELAEFFSKVEDSKVHSTQELE